MVVMAGAVVAGAAVAAAAAFLALTSTTHDGRREGGACGAGAAAVATTPPSQECAVCLSELAGAGAAAGCCEPGSSAAAAMRTLPGCGHGFHAECIGRWLPLRAECPLCRRPVLPEVAADGRQPAATTLPAVAAAYAVPAWSRTARMACGFGAGRVVWTRSPSAQQL